MARLMITLFSILTISGCTTLYPVNKPETPVDMPSQYSLYTEGEKGLDEWWRAFDSEELNDLVAEALSNNFDIHIAWARLKQAQAAAQKINATKLPILEYDLGAQYNRTQSRTSSKVSETTTDSQMWQTGLVAAYEVDLWGKLNSQRQAEAANSEAAWFDLEAAGVTVSAQVVSTWVDILAVRQNIFILKKQIKNNETLLDLQKLRFSNGRAKALDVSQQREALAAAKAELPLLEASERQLMNSLTLLLGKATFGKTTLSQGHLPDLIPLPTTGLPADLLAARPDVRAAGLRLYASDWEVAAARADRLPAIGLSAQAAFSSGSLNLLFDNWITTLSSSITGPIFDAGRKKAEVVRTRAVAEERLATYAKTVATAVQEVENSLIGEDRQRSYVTLLNDQLAAVRLTLKDARLQYQNGQSDYLSYLTAWTSVQRLERQIVTEQAALIKTRVSLYRTLGGVRLDTLAG